MHRPTARIFLLWGGALWCPREESNLRPSVPETGALSTELRGQRYAGIACATFDDFTTTVESIVKMP